MLFELFAGRRPWLAKSDFEMVQVTSRDPRPICASSGRRSIAS